MGKFQTAAILAGVAIMGFAGTASAATINNATTCQAEGGTMVNVKNSDYCLVPIRDKIYADPIYDGNQLGIVECPGNTLEDGKYCMYPVTIRPETPKPNTTTVAPSATEMVIDSAEEIASDVADDMK